MSTFMCSFSVDGIFGPDCWGWGDGGGGARIRISLHSINSLPSSSVVPLPSLQQYQRDLATCSPLLSDGSVFLIFGYLGTTHCKTNLMNHDLVYCIHRQFSAYIQFLCSLQISMGICVYLHIFELFICGHRPRNTVVYTVYRVRGVLPPDF
jgi:hypothetical protein